MSTTTPHRVEELRFRLRGGVHEPGDAYYEDTTTLFNTMIDPQPATAGGRVPRRRRRGRGTGLRPHHALPIAVRAGGHSVAGLSLCDDGLVLDLRGMADIDVDAGQCRVRIGGGAIWADVDRVGPRPTGSPPTGGRIRPPECRADPRRRLRVAGAQAWPGACDNLVAAAS